MSDPITFRITLEMVEAIRRDGTVGTDLTVAEWMQRSRPHGEYLGSSEQFAIRSAQDGLQPVGPRDWVVRIGTRFLPCPPELFIALTQQQADAICEECHDPCPSEHLQPTPAGQKRCADCLLEAALNEQPANEELDRNTLPLAPERSR